MNRIYIYLVLVLIIITLASSAQAETVKISSYNVSFEQPIIHEIQTNSRTNPDICRVNVFTTGPPNYIASFTIKRFEDPQDAGRDAMESEVRDILINYGAAERSIALDEYAIDQCYSIKGTGNNGMGVNWIAIYYWADRYGDSSRQNWLGRTNCAVISNYPNWGNLLNSIHILNRTLN
jgi:hypothetical protein